jgi:type I restriction-modification system DNA methylase subunit
VDILESVTQSQLPLIQEDNILQESMEATLKEIREILHRRGRFSSRNEALDEVCKLLFAHVMSISHGDYGISMASVNHSGKGLGSATNLKKFVQEAFEKYLPSSLAHEISHEDFELKLKPQEIPLADEIIRCFEHLAPKKLFEAFKNLEGFDIINNVFGAFLVDSFVDEKQLGQYLTPTEVVKFMVQIALLDMSQEELALLCNPRSCTDFGLILDPSCGTASFLTELLKTLYVRMLSNYPHQEVSSWVEKMVSEVIIGIDKSERMIKLALTNIAMFGLPAARLHLANSLARSGPEALFTNSLKGRVRLILTNPPFGAEFTGKDLSNYKIATDWSRSKSPTIVSEVLLLERYIDWLMPGGQCLAVIPDSILTNKGIFEDLRRGISHKIELRSIISLPAMTFSAAGTTTKTSILHFRKLSEERRSSTYFGLCHHIGYNVVTRGTQKVKVANSRNDLSSIVEEFNKTGSELTFGRRVPQVEQSARWDAAYHASIPIAVERQIKNIHSHSILVTDIAQLSSERIDPRKLKQETFEYIEISDVDPRTCMIHPKTLLCSEAPSRARKVVHAGDVLFSTVRPDRKIVGIVRDNQEGNICTTGFAVLRPKNVNSLTLAYLLKTDFVITQVMRNNMGIAYPAIEEACLLEIIIPIRLELLLSLNDNAQAILTLERQVQEMREDFIRNITNAMQNSIM